MRYGASHTEVFLPWSQEMEQWCNHLGGKSFGAKLRRLMLAVICGICGKRKIGEYFNILLQLESTGRVLHVIGKVIQNCAVSRPKAPRTQ